MRIIISFDLRFIENYERKLSPLHLFERGWKLIGMSKHTHHLKKSHNTVVLCLIAEIVRKYFNGIKISRPPLHASGSEE